MSSLEEPSAWGMYNSTKNIYFLMLSQSQASNLLVVLVSFDFTYSSHLQPPTTLNLPTAPTNLWLRDSISATFRQDMRSIGQPNLISLTL